MVVSQPTEGVTMAVSLKRQPEALYKSGEATKTGRVVSGRDSWVLIRNESGRYILRPSTEIVQYAK